MLTSLSHFLSSSCSFFDDFHAIRLMDRLPFIRFIAPPFSFFLCLFLPFDISHIGPIFLLLLLLLMLLLMLLLLLLCFLAVVASPKTNHRVAIGWTNDEIWIKRKEIDGLQVPLRFRWMNSGTFHIWFSFSLSLSLSLFLFFFLYFSFSSCCHAGMGLMDGRREGGWCRPHIYTYGEVAAMMSRLFPPPQRVIHIQVHSTGDKTDI